LENCGFVEIRCTTKYLPVGISDHLVERIRPGAGRTRLSFNRDLNDAPRM